eukprot:m.23976 g.23976  ORF g.23976 m.23976 type:complete len:176 (+) comp4201_c0_seq1:985-1512(+)
MTGCVSPSSAVTVLVFAPKSLEPTTLGGEGRQSATQPCAHAAILLGRKGVSQAQYYDVYLKPMQLNQQYVEFTKMDLSYLLKANYDPAFVREVYEQSVRISSLSELSQYQSQGPFRMEYTNHPQFTSICKPQKIMDDWKSGVPRTGYMGVVSTWIQGKKVHIAPRRPWSGYHPGE